MLAAPSHKIANQPVGQSSQRRCIDQHASANFSMAKVLAILTIVAGHWFSGTILWIPVTIGLFIFAFSSAYFTSVIYGTDIDKRRFWHKKLKRLGVRFWVTQAVVAIVVVVEGKTLLHWHTLVHLSGMSGVLNWLSIRNRSGLGAGLWFFTLLLIFYVAYPVLASLAKTRTTAMVTAIAATAAAIALQETVKVGHELWLTALGFILGTIYGLHQRKLPPAIALLLSTVSIAVLLGMNLFGGHRQFNTVLIALSGIFISLWLANARLPNWRMMNRIAGFEKYLLEIFILHTYLFVHLSRISLLDFLLSLVLIVIISAAANKTAGRLSALLSGRPALS